MQLRYLLELFAQRIADICILAFPRPRPAQSALREIRIVSHRGEFDNQIVRENTMAAFEAAAAGGVWGVEMDVRWTRDLQPVVIHDPDTQRVFGLDVRVATTDLADLQRQVPSVPSLAEIVERLGGRLHLMIELKRDDQGCDETKAARLAEIFAPLTPGEDYHFLALGTDLLAPAAFAGAAACLLVAEVNTRACSRQVLAGEFGGLCGHYLLLNSRLVALHHRQGQKLGTGFVSSRFGFYRELNRGVDWVFTNRGAKLASIRARLLDP